MSVFAEALAWLLEGLGPDGRLWLRLGEHVFYTGISILIAAVIACPIGYAIGHTGRGREIAVAITGAARALPSFGLILLLVLALGGIGVGLGVRVVGGSITAFVLLAIPSILAGAYTGLQAIDRATVDAARGIGMTGWQVLGRVEIPLGLPLLLGGLRNATLQVVATATLAGYVNLGGLGLEIIQGLPLRRYDQMLGAALLVVVLALVLDGLFAILMRVAERALPSTVSAPSRRLRAWHDSRAPAPSAPSP